MGKRILLVSDTYLPVISGVTTVVSQLAKTLRERGHIVKVLVLDDPKLPNDPNILAVPSFPGFLDQMFALLMVLEGFQRKLKNLLQMLFMSIVLGIWESGHAIGHKYIK